MKNGISQFEKREREDRREPQPIGRILADVFAPMSNPLHP